MSALERSGKLCRSRRKAPGPSRCRLPPDPRAQGRVAGRRAERCSGAEEEEEELLFALMLFCREGGV